MSDYTKAAVVDNSTNVVVNTIMADSRYDIPPANSYLVDITDLAVGVGWSYDPATETFSPPVDPPEV